MEDVHYQPPSHPVLIVISGPSGVGKDTIAQCLLERRNSFYFVVTATTRPPRDGEVQGVDYFFVSQDEFARMIKNGELLEYARVYNDWKGVPKRQIRDALASGKDVLMRLDVQGAATIRKLIPEAILIFLAAESEEALARRLEERQSESSESLQVRIANAWGEMNKLADFDYRVLNAEGRQEDAVDKILAIVDAAHCRVEQKPIKL